MTDLNHVDLGNNPAEMHGLAWRTVADATALAALNIVTADVTQCRLVKQTDTGQFWLPITTGTNATFVELFTSASVYAGLEGAFFGCDQTDSLQTGSGTTVIGSAPFKCRNLAWQAGSTAKLVVNGYEIRCSGALDTTSGPMPAGGISSAPTAGGNGAAATTGGTAGATLSALTNGLTTGGATGGTAGGAGTTTTGGQGAAPTSLTAFGSGGAGGAGAAGGGSGASGGSNSGGASRSGATCTGARDLVAPPTDLLIGGVTSTGGYNVQQGGAGGAGGGAGAGDGSTAGPGGGGGGAGAIPTVVYCRRLVLGGSTPAGAFSANGSNGGTGGTPAGGNRGGGAGGGGGGGGYLVIVAGEIIGSATNFATANGGNGGNGGDGTGTGTGGNGGTGGGGGKITVFDLKNRVRKVVTGTGTGTAGTAASGNTHGTGGAGETVQMSWP